MGWARFDDAYSDHPKILAAGPMAELLDMRAIIWCCRLETDGFVPAEALPRIAHELKNPGDLAARLVRVKRWRKVRGGWQIVDFLDYNPSRSENDEKRDKARERMARARATSHTGQGKQAGKRPSSKADKSGARSQNVRANNARTSREVRLTPSRPVPTPITEHLSTGLTTQSTACGQDEEVSTTARAAEVIARLAAVRMHGRTVKDPDAYRRRVETQLEAEFGPRLAELLDEFPGAPADSLAGELLGEPNRLADYRKRDR